MPISKIKAQLRDPTGYSANGAHDSARQENSQTRRAQGGPGDLSMQLDDFRYKECFSWSSSTCWVHLTKRCVRLCILCVRLCSEPPTVLPGQRNNTPPASPSNLSLALLCDPLCIRFSRIHTHTHSHAQTLAPRSTASKVASYANNTTTNVPGGGRATGAHRSTLNRLCTRNTSTRL